MMSESKEELAFKLEVLKAQDVLNKDLKDIYLYIRILVGILVLHFVFNFYVWQGL